jgi:hypothetical protein
LRNEATDRQLMHQMTLRLTKAGGDESSGKKRSLLNPSDLSEIDSDAAKHYSIYPEHTEATHAFYNILKEAVYRMGLSTVLKSFSGTTIQGDD